MKHLFFIGIIAHCAGVSSLNAMQTSTATVEKIDYSQQNQKNIQSAKKCEEFAHRLMNDDAYKVRLTHASTDISAFIAKYKLYGPGKLKDRIKEYMDNQYQDDFSSLESE